MVRPSRVPPLKRLVFEIDWKRLAGSSGSYIVRCIEPTNYRPTACLTKVEEVVALAKVYKKSAEYDELFVSYVITDRALDKLRDKAEEISKLFSIV